MAIRRQQLVIGDIRQGINEIDPPIANGPDDKFLQNARNVEFFAGGLCRKRRGSAEPAGLTYSATSGKYAALFRHAVGTDENATELWALTDGGGIGRMTISSLEFVDISPGDALTTSVVQHATATSLNGKLILAARSAADRMHVWDGTTFRRLGLDRTAAAPGTATAGGSVTDTRRYRVTYVKKTGSTYDLRSEPSDETADVALASQKTTITKNTSPGESETHWELWASSTTTTFSTWYKIGEEVVGTTTIEDDNTDISAVTGEIGQFRGEQQVFPSAKFVTTDENRLIAAGSWETAAYASRVWISAIVGTTDIGDEERTPDSVGAAQTFYIDVAKGVDGGITGIAGPVADAIYVFKTSSVWKLVKTGVVDNPYRVVSVARNIGAINNKSIVLCEDESGQPAIGFLSRRGPYRISIAGIEYLGADIEETYSGINYDADTVVSHGLYYHKIHQLWWWIATTGSEVPDLLLVYDTHRGQRTQIGVRGGWTVHDGSVANALCSVMYSKDLGTSTASYDLLPYFGDSANDDKIVRCDVAATYTDYDATTYQSYFRTRAYGLGALNARVTVKGVAIVAKPDPLLSPCLWMRVEQEWQTSWAEYVVTVPPSRFDRVVVSQPEPTSVRSGPPSNDFVSVYVYDDPTNFVAWEIDLAVVEYDAESERGLPHTGAR